MKLKKTSLLIATFFLLFSTLSSLFFESPQALMKEEKKEFRHTNDTLSTRLVREHERKVKEKAKIEKENQFIKKINETLQHVNQSKSQGNTGIYYFDCTSGKSVSINGNQEFLAASTSKVALAMKIADLVQQKKVTLHQKVVETASDYEDGTGSLAGDGISKYTIRELIRALLVDSDNIAKNMLFRQFSKNNEDGYDILKKEYLHQSSTNGQNLFTAKELGTLMCILTRHQKENPTYAMILNDLKHTSFHERLETNQTKGHVAHKIGSLDALFHDVGYFDTKHPYILVVCTNHVVNAPNFISQISNAVWKIQQTQYPN